MEKPMNSSPDGASTWADREGSFVPAYLRQNKAEGMDTPDTFMPLGMEQASISTPSELDAKFAAAQDIQRSVADQEKAKGLLQSIETPALQQHTYEVEQPTEEAFDSTSYDKPLTYTQQPAPTSIFGGIARFNDYLERAVKNIFK